MYWRLVRLSIAGFLIKFAFFVLSDLKKEMYKLTIVSDDIRYTRVCPADMFGNLEEAEQAAKDLVMVLQEYGINAYVESVVEDEV